LDTASYSNSGQDIANSILSLESIKEELQSELLSLKPKTPLKVPVPEPEINSSTPTEKDTMFSPKTQDSSDLFGSDDDCAIIDEKLSPLNQNGSGSGSAISISNIRTALKEKGKLSKAVKTSLFKSITALGLLLYS